MPEVLVVNASPLIFLGNAGQIDLLHVAGASRVAAYRRGHIKDPRQVMMTLRSAGMWLSDAVIESALRLARIPPTS